MPKLPGAVNNDQKTEYQSDPVLKRITQKNKFYAQIITNKEAQLKNDPENVTLCLDLAAFYARLEEYEKAEEYFIKAIEIKPEIAGGYFLLADLYKKQGKTEEEVAILNKCLESAQLQPDGRIKAELRLEELSKIKT
jgi:tetratricopeptide (TPR) repeat protein